MPSVAQTSIRTAGEGVLLEGALGLPGGMWFFEYNRLTEMILAAWRPFGPLPETPELNKVEIKVWTLDASIVSPGMRSKNIKPLMEKTLDLGEQYVTHKHAADVQLGLYLVFAVEGSGPAVGEDSATQVAELANRLSAAEAELERVKSESSSEIASLKSNFDDEKQAMRDAFQGEKAALSKSFNEEKTSIENSYSDKIQDLDKKLAVTTSELSQARTVKTRLENLSTAMRDGEESLKAEAERARQARDELNAKYQLLSSEKQAADRQLQDANKELEGQQKKLQDLKAASERAETELAVLQQTTVPENQRLKSDNQALNDAVGSLEENLEQERTAAAEVQAKHKRLETDNKRLEDEAQESRSKCSQLETTASKMQSDLDMTSSRLESLERDVGLKEAEIGSLRRDLRSASTASKSAEQELKRAVEMRDQEITEAEVNARGLLIKITGLETQLAAVNEEVEEFDKANAELKRSVSKEVAQREGLERVNERLNTQAQTAKDEVDDANRKISRLQADLNEANANLETFQNTLRDERVKSKKGLNDLKKERSDHIETNGKLDALRRTTDAKISRLNNEVDSITREARELTDAQTKVKSELENVMRELDRSKSSIKRQERTIEEEKERSNGLKLRLDNALQRELEYDPERLYKQLDDEKEAHERSKKALEEEQASHAAEITRLQEEMQTNIDNLNSQISTLQTNVQALQSQVASLSASLDQERTSRANAEANFNAEVSRHQQTAANLAQENRNALNWMNACSAKQGELNNAVSTIANQSNTIMHQNSRISSLESANAHSGCVTKSSVDQLVESYMRLIEVADEHYKRGRYRKAHYPDGYVSTSSGRLEIDFVMYEG